MIGTMPYIGEREDGINLPPRDLLCGHCTNLQKSSYQRPYGIW